MWLVYLMVLGALIVFFAIDMYFERFGEIFACRAYDMLAKVSSKNSFVPSNLTLKYDEHRNKTKILRND